MNIMNRAQRLSSFWAWLPAFRAVGETQHLPSAGAALRVSPPALSRTIKLLERDLGVKLFRRSGRQIVLTPQGEELLTATRDAMRILHDAVDSICENTSSDAIKIMSAGAITSTFLLSSLDALLAANPNIVPHISTDDEDVVPRLLRGDLDLVLQSRALRHPKVITEHLGTIKSSLYCGRAHPLYRKSKATIKEVQQHPFVGPPLNAVGQVEDGWPDQYVRVFGAHVDQMRLGRTICARGRLLAVLPDVIASSSSAQEPLWRIPLEGLIPETNLFAVHRPVLGKNDRAVQLLGHLRRELAHAVDVHTARL